MFEDFINSILKFIYTAVAFLPEIPSFDVAVNTFELVEDCIIAVRYFLPLDTICELTALFIGFQALRLLLILLRSKSFRAVFSILLGRFNTIGGLISRVAVVVLQFFGVGSGSDSGGGGTS